MDVETVSWVGDMYQKFEAMCVEAEENVYQDTVEFVESQAKTVGACVKRFYSDVMQDLLPLPSDDLEKRESPASHMVNYARDVIHGMPEIKTKKEPIKKTTEELGKGNSNVRSLLSEEFTTKSFIQDATCETDEDRICVEISGGNECVSSTSITSSSLYPTALDELSSNEGMPKELTGTCNLEEAIRGEISGDYVEEEQAVDGKMKLEESCVLVDKYEAYPPHREGKQRSYKKKMKDALYTRRSWSRSKNRAILDHKSMEARSDASGRADNDRGNESSLESGWELV